jgi:hypothetical protein
MSKLTDSCGLIAVLAVAIGVTASNFSAGATANSDEEAKIAKSLAAMVSASLAVIARNQDRIDNPDIADKGLDGKTALAQALQLYQEETGTDPLKIDKSTRQGRLLAAETNAIVEVMDAHQKTIKRSGIGFKGFIPFT